MEQQIRKGEMCGCEAELRKEQKTIRLVMKCSSTAYKPWLCIRSSLWLTEAGTACHWTARFAKQMHKL